MRFGWIAHDWYNLAQFFMGLGCLLIISLPFGGILFWLNVPILVQGIMGVSLLLLTLLHRLEAILEELTTMRHYLIDRQENNSRESGK